MADDHHDEPAGESASKDVPAGIAAKIDDGVNRILKAFEEKLKYDASKQETVDRLYDELQGHRADFVAQAARPFIVGMIRHHTEIGKLVTAVRDAPAEEMSSAKFCQLLESLLEDVEHVLRENGVTAYRAEISGPFDSKRQTLIGVVPTTDEKRSGTVAACHGPGFEHGDRILVRARVSRYGFPPPSSDS